MSSKYDSDNVKVFDNEVLENLIEDQIITKLNLSQFATADNSLAQKAGMKKVIRKCIGTGTGEVLAMGEGNTGVLGSYFIDTEYEVETYQAKYPFYDEQEMDDPIAIQAMADRMTSDFINKVSVDVVAELGKGTNKMYGCTWGYDVIADANSAFPKEDPSAGMCFLLVSRKDLAAWKKSLKNELHYVEAFARTGYIGSVDSVNMFVSDAVPQGKAFVATKEAVTVFTKKGFELEAERDADHRLNTIYGRKVDLTALTNDDKVIVLLAAADPRTGKTLVAEKPEDWDSKYNTDYYFYDAVAGTCKLNTESDWDKVAGFIYA